MGLAAIAVADIAQIAQNLQEVMQNNSVTRTFGSTWATSFIEAIDEYGCWCYFQDDHGRGRGPAANEVDEQCLKLHQGYECIIIDAMERAIRIRFRTRFSRHRPR